MPPATKDTLAQIDELKSLGATMQEIAAELKQPVHLGHDGASLSYWGGEESVSLKPAMSAEGRMKSVARVLPRDYKRNERWKSASDFLRDGFLSHKEGKKDEWIKAHRDHLEPLVKTIQGMNTQVSLDGGALVIPEFNNTIMERVYDNQIWASTDQYTVTGNGMTFLASAETSRVTGSRAGGLQAYWTDEGGAATASKPTFRRFDLKLKKLMVVVYLTQEMIDDGGVAIEQHVSKRVGQEFNWMLGNSVFRGTGTGQPLGIFNAPNLLSITKETGQLAATIVTENIDKMWARRIANGNYRWYHNQDCGPQLDRLAQDVGTGGIALNRPAGIAGVMSQTLKTAPRDEIEFASTLGTVGDICLADNSQYVTIAKGGVAQAVSAHVEFLTDQMALRFTMRVDGQPWEHSAITPANGSNTQSPFIVLATRA